MDFTDVFMTLVANGMTLHVHAGEMYLCGGRDAGHFHPLGEGCEAGDCNFRDEWEVVLFLSQHEADLWEMYEAFPCFATTYDVDTQAWHPEWVTVNAGGQLTLVEPEEPHDD